MEKTQGMLAVVMVVLDNGERHSVAVPCDSAAAAVRELYRGYSLPTAMTVLTPAGAIPIRL